MTFSRLLYEQEPVERKLGQRIVSATRRSKRYFKRVWDYVYDVPLLSSLHQLLSDPFVLDEVRGTLTLIPADNLASQYLGGYKALNAALRKCRHCLAVQEVMQSLVRVI